MMEMIYYFLNSSDPIILKVDKLPRTNAYLQDIFANAKNAPYCFYSEDPTSLGFGFCILYDMYSCVDTVLKNKNIAKNIATIQKALTFIQDNFLSHLTLDTIAKHVSFSKYYFLNLFKKYTQKTPLNFCLELRLTHAYSLLMKGSSVTDAAYSSGFSNLSYFTRAFKNYYGSTPKNILSNSFPKDKH